MKNTNKKIFKALFISRKKDRVAQIQIMETISVMLIFFMLIVLGFVFYIRTTGYTQIEKITKIQELESIRVSQAISFLPELQCSSKNIIDDMCFDKYKLDAFLGLDHTFYYNQLYYSNIVVTKIYPGTEYSWRLYQKDGNGTSYMTFIPILIYDPVEKTNSFGVLTVQSYARD